MAASISDLKKTTTDVVDTSAMKPKDQVRHLLQQNSAAIKQALPAHMNPERLMRVAQTAVTTTPKLLECYVPSLLGGVMQCAQLGLEPNTVLGHSYLVPFWNNKKRRHDVQVILGYKGLIDLMRRSGQITSIAAHAVRENDAFDYLYGLEERLEHRPADTGRGDITHFYAVVHMKDGGHQFEVMSKADVDYIMAGTQSSGKYGPWKDHYEEMGRKTIVRRLAKWLPLSVEMATAVALDAKAEHGTDQSLEGVLDGEFEVMADVPDEETGETVAPDNAEPPKLDTLLSVISDAGLGDAKVVESSIALLKKSDQAQANRAWAERKAELTK